MKKTLLLLAAAFSLSFAHAQNISFGVKAGPNFSNMGGNDNGNLLQDPSDEFEVDTKSYTGMHIGFFASFGITDIVSIQPEFIYSSKGFKVSEKMDFEGAEFSFTGTQKLNYIDVPVLLNIKTGNLFFEVGPQFSYLVDANTNMKLKLSYTDPYDGIEYNETLKPENFEKEGFKSLDLGYALGLGYKFGNGLMLGARYTGGFSTIFDEDYTFDEDEFYMYAGGEDGDDRPEIKTGTFQLSIGYMFGL